MARNESASFIIRKGSWIIRFRCTPPEYQRGCRTNRNCYRYADNNYYYLDNSLLSLSSHPLNGMGLPALLVKKFHVHLTKSRGTSYQVSVVLSYAKRPRAFLAVSLFVVGNRHAREGQKEIKRTRSAYTFHRCIA